MADAIGQPNQLHSDLLQLIDSSKRIEEILRKAGGMGGRGSFAQDVAAHAIGGRFGIYSSQTMASAAESLDRLATAQQTELLAQQVNVQANAAGIALRPTAAAMLQQAQAAGKSIFSVRDDPAFQRLHNQRNFFKDQAQRAQIHEDTAIEQQESSLAYAGKYLSMDAKQKAAGTGGGSGSGSGGGGNSGLWKTAGVAAAVKFMLAGGTGGTYGNYAANQQLVQSAGQTNAAMFTALATAIFSPSKVLSAVRAGARFVGSGWGK